MAVNQEWDHWIDALRARWYRLKQSGHDANLDELLPLLEGCECKHNPAFLADAAAALADARRTFVLSSGAQAAAGAEQTDDGPVFAIAGFERFERIGRGGMGALWKAWQSAHSRWVAIKTPLDWTARDSRRRFLREARVASRICHPHLCPIYETGESDGVPYFVMAFIEGIPLSLRPSPRLPEVEGAELVRKVALAVAELHRNAILHRDLKPSNIIRQPGGDPVVVDFGLAKPVGNAAELTGTGAMVGTPSYASLEQLQCDPVTTRSDIYSLGVILFELLTGRLPYSGTNVSKLTEQILHGPPSWPMLGSDGLQNICLRAMAKSPVERFTSMDEFAESLRQWISGECQSNVCHGSANDLDCESASAKSSQRALFRRGWRHPQARVLIAASTLVLAIAVAFLLHVGSANKQVPASDAKADSSIGDGSTSSSANASMGVGDRGWSEERSSDTAVAVLALPECSCSQVFFSKGGRSFMSATTRGTVHEFETESGKEIGEFRTAESPIDSFCLSPDWSKYATVSKDRHTLTVWDRQKNSPLRSWNDSQEVVGTARFSPDNENFGLAFTASPSRLVVLGTGAQLLEAAPRRSGWIMSIAANSMLVNGDAPEEIVVFDSSSGKRMRTLKGINRQAVAAAMSPDGRFVAGGGYDGDLFLWDTRDELPQKLSEVGRGLPMTISWSGDSRMFAVSRVARDDANHLPTLEHVVEVYRQIDGIPRLFWTFDQVHHAGQAHFLSGDQIMVVEDYDSKTNKKNLIRLRIPTAAAHQPE